MTIITLTTDWGTGNHYAGAVKGAILKQIPGAVIIDISHDIHCFDIMEASFVLRNAALEFPPGTIHLIGVNTEGGIDTPHLVVHYKNQYFIGADNGIFSLMIDDGAHQAAELDILQDTDYFTFSTRDVFIKAAAMLASGKPFEEIGTPYAALNERIAFKPVVYPEKIIGKVIFIDHYENVFVNIGRKLFNEAGRGRPFEIGFRLPGEAIHQLHQAYSDVVPGERLALFGATGFLEIAINQGKAASLLGLQMNDTVSVEFYDNDK
ncbi:MAG: SAM-dependent chlorinase/fluorinase [Bacteroidales bacterium]|nr:SAM-dependent chlorinase/fluorinase [Bacteroidales bacterium]